MIKSNDKAALENLLSNTQYKAKEDLLSTTEYRDHFNANRLFENVTK